MTSLLWVTYPGKKKMENGLILMVDLPRKNGGLIMMGDLPKWKEEEWSHSLGDLPRGRNGHILMGDLPR